MGQVTKLGRVSHVIKKSETSFRHFRHVTDKLQTSLKHVLDKSGDFFCLKHVFEKSVNMSVTCFQQDRSNGIWP